MPRLPALLVIPRQSPGRRTPRYSGLSGWRGLSVRRLHATLEKGFGRKGWPRRRCRRWNGLDRVRAQTKLAQPDERLHPVIAQYRRALTPCPAAMVAAHVAESGADLVRCWFIRRRARKIGGAGPCAKMLIPGRDPPSGVIGDAKARAYPTVSQRLPHTSSTSTESAQRVRRRLSLNDERSHVIHARENLARLPRDQSTT